MIDRIHVGCCAHDLWLARICVASLRHWYPEVPISLLRDPSRGRVATAEIEEHWGVTSQDVLPQFAGWSYTKLQLLFQPQRERFLFLDADTILAGRLLEQLPDSPFVVAGDQVENPDTHPVMPMYYDHRALQRLDPEFRFPGYVWNAGQFVATSGLLTPEDFAPFVDWAGPALRQPEIFFTADQGVFNYLLASRPHAEFRLYHDARAREVADLAFDPADGERNPFLIHWAGAKPVTPQRMLRRDLLEFFEAEYYAAIPGGAAKRSTRALARTAPFAARTFVKQIYRRLRSA